MDQVGAVLFGTAVAAVIAIWGILTQRALARRRATMDHMAMADMDRDMIAARKKFIALAKVPGGLAAWAEPDKESSEEVEAIRLVLNDFELISVAIQFGIADYDFYERYNHGTVVRYWKQAAPFVHALRERTGRQTIYAEFEQLVQWVDKTQRPPRRKIWFKRLF